MKIYAQPQSKARAQPSKSVTRPSPIPSQPKLRVNTPGDIYEQEADRIAAHVMSMREGQPEGICACGGRCPKCRSTSSSFDRLQARSRWANRLGGIEAPSVVSDAVLSAGEAIDLPTRAFMETRFGHDFSRVRVHTDALASESAESVNALAFTLGNHIVFGRGRYAPETSSGRSLLAHELTHTIQQRAESFDQEPSPPVQRQAKSNDDLPGKRDEPTARGSMLLKMFWSGVTKSGLPFGPISKGDFDLAALQPDARFENVQAIKNGADVTYTFITSESTGVIQVREHDNKAGLDSYYQSGNGGKGPVEVTSQQTALDTGKKLADTKLIDEGTAVGPITSQDKTPDTQLPPERQENTPAEKPKRECDQIPQMHPAGRFYFGIFDQTWLPGNNDKGEPCHQGDLGKDLEQSLLKIVKRIKASTCVPKQIKISVILSNYTGGPAPGFRYAAENAARNMKIFLETRLPRKIVITETHGVEEITRTPLGSHFVPTITFAY